MAKFGIRKPNIRVGISSAGGDMVCSAVLSLKRSKYINFEIFAFNSIEHPILRQVADTFAILPKGDDPTYAEVALEHAHRYNLDVFVPWSDEEALVLSQYGDVLKADGCSLLASDTPTLNLISNKAATYCLLRDVGITVPDHLLVCNFDDLRHAAKNFGYPKQTVIVKPSVSRGGRGVKILLGENPPEAWIGKGQREQQLEALSVESFPFLGGESLIVMPCLSGPVYDVDVFRREKQHHASLVRQRINPAGIPYRGSYIMDSPEIERYAEEISEALNLNSLHDIDMMTDKRLGTVLLEVNPRPSGSIAGLSAAGGNLFEYSIACTATLDIPMRNPEKNNTVLTYTESLSVK